MTVKKSPVSKPATATHTEGFDITCTIGRVEFGGDRDPFEAAFELIGKQASQMMFGQENTFRFDPSGENKLFTEVTVRFPESPDAGPDPDEDRW